MSVLVLLAVVAVFIGVVSLALGLAVVAGAGAYVSWRDGQRDSLRSDPVGRALYGPYQSPFPWHNREHGKRGRDAA